jgi:hypothetical protein
LRLTTSLCKLNPVKYVAKIGVLLVIAVLAGTPLLACMLPGGATTDEESACCREMGSECDHGTMPSSHSCCQTLSPSDQAALVKASFKLSMNLLYLGAPEIDSDQGLPQVISSAISIGHSPPEGSPASFQILRI